jgi:primosomal protein N'
MKSNNKHYYNILINKRIYTYFSPKDLPIGLEVVVPLRSKKVSGFIIENAEEPSFKTREIIHAVRQEPQFKEEMVALADWIANKYYCYRSKALELILPK